MKIFKTVQEAFAWTFDEKEDLFDIKCHFNLTDEVETINDVIEIINDDELVVYLLENSLLVEEYKRGYVFYEQEDITNDEIYDYLVGKLGENEQE